MSICVLKKQDGLTLNCEKKKSFFVVKLIFMPTGNDLFQLLQEKMYRLCYNVLIYSTGFL